MKKFFLLLLLLCLAYFAHTQGWLEWVKTHTVKIIVEKELNKKSNTSVGAVRGKIIKDEEE